MAWMRLIAEAGRRRDHVCFVRRSRYSKCTVYGAVSTEERFVQADQKAQKGNMDEMFGSLQTDQLASLKCKAPSLKEFVKKKMDFLQEEVKQLQSDVGCYGTTLQKLQSQISAQAKTSAESTASIATSKELDEKVQTLQKGITDMASCFGVASFATMNEHLSKLSMDFDMRFAAVEDKLHIIEGGPTKVGQNLQALQINVDKLTSLHADQTAMTKTVQLIRSDLLHLGEDLAKAQSSWDDHIVKHDRRSTACFELINKGLGALCQTAGLLAKEVQEFQVAVRPVEEHAVILKDLFKVVREDMQGFHALFASTRENWLAHRMSMEDQHMDSPQRIWRQMKTLQEDVATIKLTVEKIPDVDTVMFQMKAYERYLAEQVAMGTLTSVPVQKLVQKLMPTRGKNLCDVVLVVVTTSFLAAVFFL